MRGVRVDGDAISRATPHIESIERRRSPGRDPPWALHPQRPSLRTKEQLVAVLIGDPGASRNMAAEPMPREEVAPGGEDEKDGDRPQVVEEGDASAGLFAGPRPQVRQRENAPMRTGSHFASAMDGPQRTVSRRRGRRSRDKSSLRRAQPRRRRFICTWLFASSANYGVEQRWEKGPASRWPGAASKLPAIAGKPVRRKGKPNVSRRERARRPRSLGLARKRQAEGGASPSPYGLSAMSG